MPKPKSRDKKPRKRVLAVPDLEHAKTAVLNSLTSASGQRTYDHAILASLSPGTVLSPASRSIAPLCSGTGFISNDGGNAVTVLSDLFMAVSFPHRASLPNA